jgi:site-specific recombinase XerD
MAIKRKVMERFLTAEEEQRLFKTVRSNSSILAQRDYAWMLLLRSTGIRISPLAALTVSDAKTALIDKHLAIRAETNKGKKAYKVYLGKQAEKALRLLLKIRRDMGFPEMGDGALVVSREHQGAQKGLSVRAFQERVKHWSEQAGLHGVSPHWLRHTLAMRIMQDSTAQDPRGVVMATLGHDNINSTAIYTQPDKSTLQNIMQEVG